VCHPSETVDQSMSSHKDYHANNSQYVSQLSIDVSTERSPVTPGFTVLRLRL